MPLCMLSNDVRLLGSVDCMGSVFVKPSKYFDTAVVYLGQLIDLVRIVESFFHSV